MATMATLNHRTARVIASAAADAAARAARISGADPKSAAAAAYMTAYRNAGMTARAYRDAHAKSATS